MSPVSNIISTVKLVIHGHGLKRTPTHPWRKPTYGSHWLSYIEISNRWTPIVSLTLVIVQWITGSDRFTVLTSWYRALEGQKYLTVLRSSEERFRIKLSTMQWTKHFMRISSARRRSCWVSITDINMRELWKCRGIPRLSWHQKQSEKSSGRE